MERRHLRFMKMQSTSSMVLLDCVPTILSRVFTGDWRGAPPKKAKVQATDRPRQPSGVVQEDAVVARISRAQPARRPEILVPVDFSADSRAAVDYAINVAKRAQARVILLHAVHLNLTPYGPANPNWLRAALCREALEKMQQIMERSQSAGVPMVSVIEEGAPVKVISEAAKRWQIDLIVMNSRQRSWWETFLGGRIREKVLRGANCPILVFRAESSKGATV